MARRKQLTKRVLNGLDKIAAKVERELSDGDASEWVETMSKQAEQDVQRAVDWLWSVIAERTERNKRQPSK